MPRGDGNGEDGEGQSRRERFFGGEQDTKSQSLHHAERGWCGNEHAGREKHGRPCSDSAGMSHFDHDGITSPGTLSDREPETRISTAANILEQVFLDRA